MIVFITTRGNSDTVAALVERKFGFDFPSCRATTYDELFRAKRTLRAVHVFTDLERLSNQDLRTAATLFRSLLAAGLTCLNDPARVMTRYELLVSLRETGINPFGIHRADGVPKPERFPVFVRGEADHTGPITDLIGDQGALDGTLARIAEGGRPLRGLVVIEYAAEPIAPGLWQRTSTFRVGSGFFTYHTSVGRQWAVKEMDRTVPPTIFEAERAAVAENAVPEVVCRAFGIAGIEWGRADHARFGDRHVIYEINTNPLCVVGYDDLPARDPTMRIVNERLAGCLRKIDWGDGAPVVFEPPLPKRRRRRHLLRWR